MVRLQENLTLAWAHVRLQERRGRVCLYSANTYLPVFPSGRAGRDWELIEIPISIDEFRAVTSGPPAQPAERAQTTEAHEAAAAGAEEFLGRAILLLGFTRSGWLLGWELSRA